MRILATIAMAGCGLLAASVVWISLQRGAERSENEPSRRGEETRESASGSAQSRRPELPTPAPRASTRGEATEPRAAIVRDDADRDDLRVASRSETARSETQEADSAVDLAPWIDPSMLAAVRAGDAKAIAELVDWANEEAGSRWRIAVAAILAGGEPESAIAELIELAESLAATDPEAPARLGGALAAILGSSTGAPFPIGDDAAREAWIAALTAVSPAADAHGAGSVLAWALGAVGANELAVDRLADLTRYSEHSDVRAQALQNLGKIASVQQIFDRIGTDVDAYPPDGDRLAEQQAYLVALLRAGGRDVAARPDIVPYLETALHGWGATTEGTQALVHLLHHVALHPVPELRPTLERFAGDDTTPNAVLRSLAERALKRFPPE